MCVFNVCLSLLEWQVMEGGGQPECQIARCSMERYYYYHQTAFSRTTWGTRFCIADWQQFKNKVMKLHLFVFTFFSFSGISHALFLNSCHETTTIGVRHDVHAKLFQIYMHFLTGFIFYTSAWFIIAPIDTAVRIHKR